MRNRILLLVVLGLLLMALPASVASAQATSQTWTSSITYYTPSNTGGTLLISFYQSDGTSYTLPSPITLKPHAAGSQLVGSVTVVPTGFAGSAVLSSDVPVIATAVQFTAVNSGNYGRMLYSGFSASGASATFYVPTFLYQHSTTTQAGVQNIEDFPITAHLGLYALGSATETAGKDVNIPAQSSFIFTGKDVTGIGAGFNGSLKITATKQGDTSTPGRVVASAQETSDSGPQAYAFEGTSQGANQIYMASMLCNAGPTHQYSFYAIQNADTLNADITITAYNTAGVAVGSQSSHTITPGAKWSIDPCHFSSAVPAGTSGSAVIQSTGGKVIAIGKVTSNTGLITAFDGQASGNLNVAAPYIRWAADNSTDFRSFVAIMNVGGAPATNIVVKYYDGNGALKATQALATSTKQLKQFIKVNTDAQSAGALTSGSFGFTPPGGAIEITSDQPIVVVTRAAKNVSLGSVTTIGEDYNGSPVVP